MLVPLPAADVPLVVDVAPVPERIGLLVVPDEVVIVPVVPVEELLGYCVV